MSNIPKEGVIKFKFNLKITKPIEECLYLKLEKWRALLFKMNLIGEYPIEKVGYGNLSMKISNTLNEFIITGTQTGKYPHLDGSQYTRIIKCDLKKMTIDALGPIAPSSETITHHAIYNNCPQIKVVFHVHHKELWKYMLNNDFDKTPKNVDYGTQEMAEAAKSCIGKKNSGIFVMAGHDEGIVSYGSTVEEAGKIILDTLKKSRT
jgi:hypothetical protein